MNGALHRFAGADPIFYDHPRQRRGQRPLPVTSDLSLDWDGWLHGSSQLRVWAGERVGRGIEVEVLRG